MRGAQICKCKPKTWHFHCIKISCATYKRPIMNTVDQDCCTQSSFAWRKHSIRYHDVNILPQEELYRFLECCWVLYSQPIPEIWFTFFKWRPVLNHGSLRALNLCPGGLIQLNCCLLLNHFSNPFITYSILHWIKLPIILPIFFTLSFLTALIVWVLYLNISSFSLFLCSTATFCLNLL